MCDAVVTTVSGRASKQGSVCEEDHCWVCHESSTPDNKLVFPCRCPSMVCHRHCLARWQLQQAGKT
jgi:E3 ubiquitin-protein ligase DOA10